ncbi:MAG TPA: hypothetical protein VKA95_07875, partial [Nitrososphaeraceae archaeon]|nr:hypothetical protein [Nitrososphaeraceae archaeon]
GAIAGSLIGAIYFWPLSIFFIHKYTGRKKGYHSKLDYKIVAAMIVIAIIAIAVICSLLIKDNPTLLMITTSLFILSILISSAIFSAKAILRISKKVRSFSRRNDGR